MAITDRRGVSVAATDPAIASDPNPGLAIKAPAKVATTGSNIVLSGVQAIDGVTVGNANERVLVKDQTDARQNGLYNAQSGIWQRTIDAANSSQLASGGLILVTGGTQNAGRTFELTTADPIVLGTSNLTYQVLAVATGNFVGDSGTGGQAGLVPAPPAGAAAAGRFLKADGTWSNAAFIGDSGAGGTPGLVPAPPAGSGAANRFLSASGSFVSLLASMVGYTLSLTGAVARTLLARLQDTPTIVDFGADPTGAVDATTAIQNAVNACAGGVLEVPAGTFTAAGPITITKPIKIRGANFFGAGGNITCSSTTNDLFVINSGYVTLEGLFLNRIGTPTNGRGIAIGTDYRAITDAQVTAGSPNLTSPAQANFTNADVGKAVYFAGAGPAGGNLFTSIQSVTSSTIAVMAANAGTTVAAGGHCQYGNTYQEIVIRDVQSYNQYIGLHVVAATQFHIDHLYALGKFPAIIENRLWSDQGDAFFTNSTLFSTDNAVGVAFQYLSGGGLKFLNNKVLNGQYCIQIIWSGQSSASPLFANNSVEGAAVNALYISNQQLLGRAHFANNYLSSISAPVFVDSAAPSTLTDATFVGNSLYSLTSGLGFDLGQITFFDIGDNVIDLGGAGIAYKIRLQATRGKVETGTYNASIAVSNASTTTVLDCAQGDTFANLPTVAANGSRFFVSDGTPASSPLTGGGTGTTAFRQNGAWKGI